eukprot:8364033-Pyramimonas_sp.AAC.1
MHPPGHAPSVSSGMELYHLQVPSAQVAPRHGEPERLVQARGDRCEAHRHAFPCWRTAALPTRTQSATGGHGGAVA